MRNEADTCRTLVVPKLQVAGWDSEPYSIAEQRWFTDGRIVVRGNQAVRKKGKKADCILRYAAEKVRTLYANPEEFRARWSDSIQRGSIVQELAQRGIDFSEVAAQAGKPDTDRFDLLCHLAFNAPVLTRSQRADRVKRRQAAFLNYYSPEAREILNELLEKYSRDGELQFTLPDVLKLPPISEHGNVNEIMDKFGGAEKLREAVNQLQALLYAA